MERREYPRWDPYGQGDQGGQETQLECRRQAFRDDGGDLALLLVRDPEFQLHRAADEADELNGHRIVQAQRLF